MSPAVVVLDEPTSGLDAHSALQLLRTCKQVGQQGLSWCLRVVLVVLAHWHQHLLSSPTNRVGVGLFGPHGWVHINVALLCLMSVIGMGHGRYAGGCSRPRGGAVAAPAICGHGGSDGPAHPNGARQGALRRCALPI